MREKNEKGITLIALVITIVILIILASISINFAFGDNNLIKKTEEGKDIHLKGEENDFIGRNEIYTDYMNIMSEIREEDGL